MATGKQLKANPDGADLAVDKRGLVVIDRQESLMQTLQRRLLTVKGGYRYDLSQGVPYFERVLGKSPDPLAVKNVFRRVLLDHPEVQDVTDITFEVNSRRELVNLKIYVTTRTGDLVLNVPVRLETFEI